MDSICDIKRNFHDIWGFSGEVVVIETGYSKITQLGQPKKDIVESGIVTYISKKPIYDYTPRQFDPPSGYTLCSAAWNGGTMRRLDRNSLEGFPKLTVRSLTDREAKLLSEELSKPGTTYQFADYDKCKEADKLARDYLKAKAAKEED